MQMLRAFADPSSSTATLKSPPSPQVFGRDPELARTAYDALFYRGRAPVWNLMGDGNWATDPEYSGKVLSIYARMLGFFQGRPA
jgi:hypothetical protein